MITEQKIVLTDRQGNPLELCLRPYREGDGAGIIACIRDEYGDTYFKRGFYDPEYLKEESEKGNITFLVAVTGDDGIAGMLILKQFYPEETMCEIASQIFRKKYRGCGLAMPFFRYGMEILLSRSYSAAFCLPVLFHDVTQRLLYRLGLRAAGLVLNVFDMAHITHSYDNGRNTKHSQGIQVMAVNKKYAGVLYLPREHQEFCRRIYERLRVPCCMAEETIRSEKLSPVSSIVSRQDELQSSLELRIHRIGADLPERLEALQKKYPLRGKQTANVFLNIQDKNAVWAYRVLTEAGYFFTGLKPLCSRNEYMVLHHPGEVEIFFEDYVLSEEFQEITDYIKKCGYRSKSEGLNGREET